MTSVQKFSVSERWCYYKWRIDQSWRLATSSLRIMPNFLIIGASKCGTTSLYHYLCQHPQIFPARTKGLQFFSYQSTKGPDWYRAQFPLRPRMYLASLANHGEGAITGEASPSYMVHPKVPERLHELLPDIKIIAMLRDPVVRAYSKYQHEFRTGDEFMSFRDAVEHEPERTAEDKRRMMTEPRFTSHEYHRHAYIDQGEYLSKLKPFYDLFDAKNILIIKSEDLFSQVQQTLDRVVKFLGVRELKFHDLRPMNAGSYARLADSDPSLNRELYAHFAPHNKALYDFIGLDLGWEKNSP